MENVQWEDGIGVSDLSDVCTKRMIYWILLDNGQASRVADVSVIINPFPLPGKPHVMAVHRTIMRPRINSGLREEHLYGQAILRAGEWLGALVKSAERKETEMEDGKGAKKRILECAT